jgi:hypothetical protein
MTRLILQMGISVDGFVAAVDGSQPWLGEREDDAAMQWKLDTVRGADAHLMRRVTYLDMAGHWPGSESAYAAPMYDISKVVFSKTLQEGAWAETRIAGGRLDEEIESIKARPGGYVIAYGGCAVCPRADPRRPRRRVPAQRPACCSGDGNADLHRAPWAAEARTRRGAALRPAATSATSTCRAPDSRTAPMLMTASPSREQSAGGARPSRPARRSRLSWPEASDSTAGHDNLAQMDGERRSARGTVAVGRRSC